MVNADLIETIEATPDTVVTLVTKRRFIVEDPVEDVIRRVVEYRGSIAANAATPNDDTTVGTRVVLATQDLHDGDDQEQAA